MSDVENHLYETIDRQNAHLPAVSRRRLVQTTAAALGSMGLLGIASGDAFAKVRTHDENSVENLTAVAATAEVLATIVNTVGPEKLGDRLDATTRRNVQAAAQQEKNHYELLTSRAVGGKAVTTTIYVPDAVFASPESLLTTLVVGDQVFINAYLLATTVFARQGTLAARSSRATRPRSWPRRRCTGPWRCSRSAGSGNDRVYAKFGQPEEAKGLPTTGQGGFFRIMDAVGVLEHAGFGFGKPGSKPGTALRLRHRVGAHADRPGRQHITIR